MINEPNLKMKAQATSVVLLLVQGMATDSEKEEDQVDGR